MREEIADGVARFMDAGFALAGYPEVPITSAVTEDAIDEGVPLVGVLIEDQPHLVGPLGYAVANVMTITPKVKGNVDLHKRNGAITEALLLPPTPPELAPNAAWLAYYIREATDDRFSGRGFELLGIESTVEDATWRAVVRIRIGLMRDDPDPLTLPAAIVV
ncbi:MAG: hypothetical protein AAF236_00780 [Verrucomicrobiota bacterium]